MVAAIPGIIKASIERLEFQVRRVSDFLQRDNWLRRRRIDGISVSTSPASVRHALGYEPEGYLVIRRSANVNVYDTAITNEQITLVASGAATISILVW